MDTGCKVIIEEEFKGSPGGTQTKAAKKVFNFTEIKQQSPLSDISPRQGGLNAVKYKNKNINFNFQKNDLENVQVKDPALNPAEHFILIKENTNIQD